MIVCANCGSSEREERSNGFQSYAVCARCGRGEIRLGTPTSNDLADLAGRLARVGQIAFRIAQECEWLDDEERERIKPLADELGKLATPPPRLQVVPSA